MSRPWLRPAALATALVLVVPVAAGLIGTALPALGYLPSAGAASASLDPVKALLDAPGLGRSILLSLGTGLAATLVSLLLVMLLLAGWLDSAAFRWLRRLLAPLLSVPHAAAALGLALVIAPSGFLVRLVAPLSPALSRPPDWLILQDPFGLTLTLGLVLKEVPFLLLMALAALHQIDLRPRLQLAESFGYGRIAAFGHTVAPLLYRQLRLPVLAVLAFSTSVVDMALVLGPSLPATLAVRVVGWMGDPDLAIRMKGAAGALLQLSVSAAALLVWFAGERALRLVWRSQAIRGHRLARDRIASRTGLGVLLGLVVLAVLGLSVLTLWSLATAWRYPDLLPSSLTLRHWLQSGPDLTGLIATTLAIGLAVSLTAAALVTALLQERVQGQGGGGAGLDTWLLDGLAFVPLLVPQVAFLFGLQVLFLQAGLDGSLFGVALSHFVFVLPYILLSLRGPWGALDPRYRQVALSLGASEQRVFWRIRLPLMLPAILTAVALGLAISVSQYLPTLLIGGGRVTTVTTEAVALASGGSRPLIAVHALAQILLPFAGFALAAALSRLLLPRLFPRRSS
ncbi:ABC transporter permease [Pannonibacter sp. SL95]|uniref:ABC transporter permease n=1 Tax=Pannonibacter sp. SL95 TaxID=2995153 RepID=UPI0022731E67|nr:ABC transporter permease subunit [Pannonibacter sp. SL95]MCY1707786.1 ABC transporter permease subunit [Pannonibacter sp. SL95]